MTQSFSLVGSYCWLVMDGWIAGGVLLHAPKQGPRQVVCSVCARGAQQLWRSPPPDGGWSGDVHYIMVDPIRLDRRGLVSRFQAGSIYQILK